MKMMQKYFYLKTAGLRIVFLVFLVSVFAGCSKEAVIPYEPYEKESPPSDPTDRAIYDILNAYQTKIIYKYDRRYKSADAFAAPPIKEFVLPYIENVLRKVFIAAYDRQKTDFMRDHMPIEIVMFGTSINYVEGGESNFRASGTAYGLSRINITGVNNYDITNPVWIRGQYATLHHEMAHILDKKYGRPVGFDAVSKGLYAGGTAYGRFTQQEARSRGFWRNYGMTNESEDFASWVDGIVTTPKEDVIAIVEENELLKKKYQMIYNFYWDKGIDIHELQVYLQKVIDNL